MRRTRLTGIDHFVPTSEDTGRTCAFYRGALGTDIVTFGSDETEA